MTSNVVPIPVRVGVNLMFLRKGRVSGTATYAWSLLSQLQHRKDIKLVIFAQGGYLDPSIDSSKVEVVKCPAFTSTFRRVLWENFGLWRKVRKRGVDLVWSAGYVAPRFTAGPRVVTVHDLYYARVPAALPLVRRQYYSIGVPWSVRHCDAVLAVSHNTANDLAREIPDAPDKTTVVHLAASQRLADADVEPAVEDKPFFIQVASVTRNKNVDTVVQAAIDLKESGVDFEVKMVGEDPYGILAEALERPGADAVVKAIGEVSDDRLASFMRGAVASINPSVYEGFGLPVLEAQALGVPVICSRGGSLPEVAGDGALFFDHDSPVELRQAMALLLDDGARRSELAAAGVNNAERFSWERAADETAQVLLSVAKR